MTYANAEQESVGMFGRDSLIRAGDGCRVVGPHVDDRRRNGDGRRGVQSPSNETEVCDRPAAHAEPSGRVAKGLGLDDELTPGRVAIDGVARHQTFRAARILSPPLRRSFTSERSLR